MKISRVVQLAVVALLLSHSNSSFGASCFYAGGGMAAWWKAEGNTIDAVTSRNGVFYGGMGYGSGVVGRAFDLSGGHIRVPDSPSLHFTNAMTAEAWVKPAGSGSYQDVISKWDVGFAGGHSYDLAIHPDGRAYLALCADGGSITTGFAITTNALPSGAWTHIAGTYDGQKIRIYVNGYKQGEVTYSAGIYPGTNDLGIGATVGGASAGSGASFFTGQIDEPALYNRALSDQEILGIFLAGVHGKCATQDPLCLQIVEHPSSADVEEGGTLELRVQAYSTLPVSYQWYYGSNVISGAQGSFYVKTNVLVSDAGLYTVAVSNVCGVIVSSGAVVSVKPRPGCAALPQGLVSWWKAEGNPNDTGSGNNGVGHNGVAYIPAISGQGFTFSNGAHIRVADHPNLRFSTGMSVDLWVAPRRHGQFQTMVAKWDTRNDLIQRSFSMGFYPSGQAFFGVSRDGTDYTAKTALTPTILATNQWTHLVATYDGKTVAIYTNGVLASSASYSNTAPMMQGNGDLGLGGVVGGASQGQVDYPLQGALDEVSLYNRALSPAEALLIYSAKQFGKCLDSQAPAFVFEPLSTTNVVGDDVTLLGGASGTPPIRYQWYAANAPVPDGTNIALRLTNLFLGMPTNYYLVAINPYGHATSRVATVHLLAAKPCLEAPSTIVAWWPGGDTANEIVSSIPSWTKAVVESNGVVGTAFSFNGRSAVVVENNGLLQLPNIAIEAWVKRASMDSVTGNPTDDFAVIYYGRENGYSLVVTRTGLIRFGQRSGTMVGLYGPGGVLPLSDTNWHHVVVNRSGFYATLFVDGKQGSTVYLPSGAVSEVTGTVSIGARVSMPSDTPQDGFVGIVDEFSIYSTPLSSVEVQALYQARGSGKCPRAFDPVIYRNPVSQQVNVGGTAVFDVLASGSGLNYQWKHWGTNLPGATNSVLVLNNVTALMSGPYTAVVSNNASSTTSFAATLSTRVPTTLVFIPTVSSENADGTYSVPVYMSAVGRENAIGFSVQYDRSKLNLVDARLGESAVQGFLLINTNQMAVGRLGVAVTLPSDAAFPNGTNTLVVLRFEAQRSYTAYNTTISFGDSPTARQVSDALANQLNGSFTPGFVTVARSSYEGDVAPRPDGNMTVTVTDWVQVGRFVARLDMPSGGPEFQRADCAPKSTKGDGNLTVTDWVQAGRYAIGLDPLELASGPTAPGGAVVRKLSNGAGGGRVLTASVPEPVGSSEINVTISMEAKGDESGVSFSLMFDKQAFEFASALKASAMGDLTMNVNTEAAHTGKIGFALVRMGRTFEIGSNDLIYVKLLQKQPLYSGSTLAFADSPIPRDVSSFEAESLSASFVDATISSRALPSLTLSRNGTYHSIAWPKAAAGYQLEQSSSVRADAVWTPVAETPMIDGENYVVTVPSSGEARFFRLHKP